MISTERPPIKLKVLKVGTIYSTSQPKKAKNFISLKKHVKSSKTAYKFKNYISNPTVEYKQSPNINVLSTNSNHFTLSNDFKLNKTEQTVNSKKKSNCKNNLTRNNNYNISREFLPTIHTLSKKNNRNFFHENLGLKTFSKEKDYLNLEGYSNYLKINAYREMRKANKIRLEALLKRLSIPKYQKIKWEERKFNIHKKKQENKINFEEIFEDNEFGEYYENTEKSNEKKNITKSKKTLFEKEKEKAKDKFHKLIKEKYKELNTCEKKYDIVISDTLHNFEESEKDYQNFKYINQ